MSDRIDPIKPTKHEIHGPGLVKNLGFGIHWFPNYINTRVRQHGIDTVLLTCVVRGTGRHVMGNETHDFSPGCVGITNYGQQHDLITTPDGVGVFNIYLDLTHHALPAMPPELSPILATILSPHPTLVHRLNRRVHLRIEPPDRLAQMLHALLHELTDQPPGNESIASHLLTIFLGDCCRAAQRSGWDGSELDTRGQPVWLERVRQYIESHYTQPITLDELAEHARVSAEHLCRRFKGYTGHTPIAYLNNRRIQAAMWQLRTTGSPIITIAMNTGYNDLTHFNRKFKNTTGQTPTAFRKNHRDT